MLTSAGKYNRFARLEPWRSYSASILETDFALETFFALETLKDNFLATLLKCLAARWNLVQRGSESLS